MKKILTLITIVSVITFTQAQEADIKKACMTYIEGFYEGDSAKLKACLQPTLNKFGFWKNKDSGEYNQVDYMSFDQALAFADNLKAKGELAKSDDPKIIEVLSVSNTIAAAKVTARWGVDYMLLSKRGDKWMIEQVIWEGPLEK